MFAVGGFFTSCIDNAEPVGVQKMREAHAEYVKACAELQKAKIAIAAAEASRILAEADYQDALTADQISQTKRDELMAELERAAKALENETDEVALAQAQLAYDKALEAWKMQLAEEQLKHEATMESLQKNLEQAQQALADYRRKVELAAAKGLTNAEKAAIDEASNNYSYWTGKHADAITAYAKEYADQLMYKSDAYTAGVEDTKAWVNSVIESLNYEKQLLNDNIEFAKNLRDKEVKEWAAAVKDLRNEIQGLEADKAKACAAWELAKHTVEPEIAAEYDAQIAELDEEIADLQKKVDKAEPKAKKANSKVDINWDNFNLVEGFIRGFLPYAFDNKILDKRPNGAEYLEIKESGRVWSLNVPYAAMDTVLNKVEKTGTDKYLGFNYIISECERPYRYGALLKATPEELAKMKELVDATVDSLAIIYAIDRAIIEDFNTDLTAGSDFLKKVEKELQGKYDEAIAALEAVEKLYTGTDKKIETASLKYEKDAEIAPLTSKDIRVYNRYVVPSSIWDNDSLLVINTIIDAYDKAAACVELVPHSYVVIDEKTLKPVERKVNMDELSVEGFLSAQISGPTKVAVDQSLYMSCVYYSQYDNKGYSVKWDNGTHKYDVTLTKALEYGATSSSVNMYIDVLKAIQSRLAYDKSLVQNAKSEIKFKVDNKNTWTKTNWQDLEACGGENAAVLFAYLEALEEYTKLGFDAAKSIESYAQFEAAQTAGQLNFFDITSLDPTGIFFTAFNAIDKGDGYAKVDFTVSETDVYNKILSDFHWSKADFEKTLPFELYAAEQYGNLVTTSTVEQWEAFKALIAKFEKSYTDQKNYNDNELAAAIKAWKESDDYKTLEADKKAKKELEKAKKEAIEEVLDPLEEVVNNYSTEIGHLTDLMNHLDAIYGKYCEGAIKTTDNLVKEIDKLIDDLYDDVLGIDEQLAKAEATVDALNDTNLYEMMEEYFKNRLDALAEDVDQAAIWADYYKKLLESLLEKYITVAE